MCNVNGVAPNEATENYHSTLQFPSTKHLSIFKLIVFYKLCSHQPCFQHQQATFFSKKSSDKPIALINIFIYLLPKTR